MSPMYKNEPMMEMYIFETSQMVKQLEQFALEIERTGMCSPEVIGEIFRMMHTIKGSSAMMLFDHIAGLAHKLEDVLYFLREHRPSEVDWTTLTDLLLEGTDSIALELQKLQSNDSADGDFTTLITRIASFLDQLRQLNDVDIPAVMPAPVAKPKYYIGQDKNAKVNTGSKYRATVFFDDGCEMENIRAYAMVHKLQEVADFLTYFPPDIETNNESALHIQIHGFQITFKSDLPYDTIHQLLSDTLFVTKLELQEVRMEQEIRQLEQSSGVIESGSEVLIPARMEEPSPMRKEEGTVHGMMISVPVEKLNMLMDLVGEMVIAESMVTQHPVIRNAEQVQLQKAAHQLGKITAELQDAVMSIRMVPLTGTFQKMNRIVRDMCRKLDKDVRLEWTGEETEVDKNIIEHISDPLMHLIRNSIDHGIEPVADRSAAGKGLQGKVLLEAKNAGSEILITVRDDGRGLNKRKILDRALRNNLLTKPAEDMTDDEIFKLIFYPGFSTKEQVTSFSGRGVGMDVVMKNLEEIGGDISIVSVEGEGTATTLKIPLTMAIIEGMNLRVGRSRFTVPITSIEQSFRPKKTDCIADPEGNEMVIVRGRCIPVLRLHQFYDIPAGTTEFDQGIAVLLEQNGKSLCLFADELLGQQQVVIKPLPAYLKSLRRTRGVASCTLLSDGGISLILDIADLIKSNSGE